MAKTIVNVKLLVLMEIMSKTTNMSVGIYNQEAQDSPIISHSASTSWKHVVLKHLGQYPVRQGKEFI